MMALIIKAIEKMFLIIKAMITLIIKAIMILTIKKNYHQACSAVGCCSKESSEVPFICNNHSCFPLSVNCQTRYNLWSLISRFLKVLRTFLLLATNERARLEQFGPKKSYCFHISKLQEGTILDLVECAWVAPSNVNKSE